MNDPIQTIRENTPSYGSIPFWSWNDRLEEDELRRHIGRMQELGLKEEDYAFYLDLRKYGSARHAGFGLGFERCVMYLTGVSNIRDVLPFPRTVGTCEL